MCGRFAFYSPAEATAALFGATLQASPAARFNIAPTQDIAAIRKGEDGQSTMSMVRWGLVPFWAKDPSVGNRMINARAETIAEKPSFRTAYRKRRCLIPADGFYEWHTSEGKKTPWFISLESGKTFAFAGIWESWQDKESGETLQTAAIITSEANAFMSRLHHRMPVILEPGNTEGWMSGSDKALEEAIEGAPRCRAWPVDRKVNNARNEGEGLIEPDGELISA